MANKDDVDSTEESSAAAADPSASDGSELAQEPDGLVDPLDRVDLDRVEADGVAGERADGDLTTDPEPDDSEKQLVTVGAAAREHEAETTSGSAVAGRVQKKAKATPRQKQVAERERRTGPVKFLKESVSELQKVVYPTGQQLINYFIVVLIFVLFIIAIVSLLDLAFGKAIIAVFS